MTDDAAAVASDGADGGGGCLPANYSVLGAGGDGTRGEEAKVGKKGCSTTLSVPSQKLSASEE